MNLAVVAAVGLAPSAHAQLRPRPTSLMDFLPARLGGAELHPMWFGPHHPGNGSFGYTLVGKASGSRRIIITFGWDPYGRGLMVRKLGETRDDRVAHYEGLRLAGRFVQLGCRHDVFQCQVKVVLAKRVLLELSVELPRDGREAIRLLKQLDLDGMETFLRQRPGPSPRAGARLDDPIADSDHRGYVTFPRAPYSLSPWQVERAVAARRELGACHRGGGKLTVSFTIDPAGKVTDTKVEDSSLRDEKAEDCVRRELEQGTFPKAPLPTKSKHTFVFPLVAPTRSPPGGP